MSINSVSSGTSSMVAALAQPEKSEVTRAQRGIKTEGSADDVKSKAPSGPTVNSNGQTIGTTINEVA